MFALEAGKNVTHDASLEPGWRHIAAVKDGGEMRLYVDGAKVGTSGVFDPADYDISNDRPLLIGSGAHDYFKGSMSDLRIYNRALSESELQELAGG